MGSIFLSGLRDQNFGKMGLRDQNNGKKIGINGSWIYHVTTLLSVFPGKTENHRMFGPVYKERGLPLC